MTFEKLCLLEALRACRWLKRLGRNSEKSGLLSFCTGHLVFWDILLAGSPRSALITQTTRWEFSEISFTIIFYGTTGILRNPQKTRRESSTIRCLSLCIVIQNIDTKNNDTQRIIIQRERWFWKSALFLCIIIRDANPPKSALSLCIIVLFSTLSRSLCVRLSVFENPPKSALSSICIVQPNLDRVA